MKTTRQFAYSTWNSAGISCPMDAAGYGPNDHGATQLAERYDERAYLNDTEDTKIIDEHNARLSWQQAIVDCREAGEEAAVALALEVANELGWDVE